MDTKIRRNGWRQGRIFTEKDSGNLIRESDINTAQNAQLILVSHDCDIVHQGVHEPLVEVFAASNIGSNCDANYLYGKNPRRLHLAVSKSDLSIEYIELRAPNRFSIDRRTLCDIEPDETRELLPAEKRVLCNWVAARYVRAALPDEFNRRIVGAWGQISSIAKKYGQNLTAIFIKLEPKEELSSGSDYKVAIIGSLTTVDWSDSSKRMEAETAISRIATELGKCDGIQLADSEILSESQITLEDLRFLTRWDFDYLSYRELPLGDIAPR